MSFSLYFFFPLFSFVHEFPLVGCLWFVAWCVVCLAASATDVYISVQEIERLHFFSDGSFCRFFIARPIGWCSAALWSFRGLGVMMSRYVDALPYVVSHLCEEKVASITNLSMLAVGDDVLFCIRKRILLPSR